MGNESKTTSTHFDSLGAAINAACDAIGLADDIAASLPPDRRVSLARTRLEEASMWLTSHKYTLPISRGHSGEEVRGQLAERLEVPRGR